MSVTTVPLRPVSKGGLWLMWIGLIALLAAGAAFAVMGTPTIGFETVKAGTGPTPSNTDVVIVKYEGKLDDGTVFDANEQVPFPMSQGLIPGFTDALRRVQKGGEYKVVIPPSLGYGDRQAGPIPPGSTLHFDITVHEIMPEEQFRQILMQQQMMQQQMQQQGGPGGAPGAPAPAPAPQ